MSNEIYGYFQSKKSVNFDEILKKIETTTGLGFSRIPRAELYNFPKCILPMCGKTIAAFIVGDKPGKTNATYIADYIDYTPEAKIDLPLIGKERLEFLVNSFLTLIEEADAIRFVVAITDSSQIEKVKTVKRKLIMSTILADFEENAPPDCAYDILLD